MNKITILIIGLIISQNIFSQKFYYAFNKKIELKEQKGKFLVKFNNAISKVNVTEKLSKNTFKIIDNVSDFITIKTNVSNINDYFPNSKVYKGYKVDNQLFYYQNEILVELKQKQSIEQIKSKLPKNSILKVLNEKYFVRLFVAESYDALDIANKIQETGLVVFSHPNFYAPAELHQVPNDTYFQNQYYLNNTGQVFNTVENHSGTSGADIRALGAWGITQGSNNIVVAVIDQGVTDNHPDLPNTRQLRLNGSNFIAGQNANDPSPDGNGNHGNACAGIIAAESNNNQGISGIAPNVRIMPIKVFSDGGAADNAGFTNAIDFAWQNGASVISNSWGFNDADDPNLIPAMVQAITRATTLGRSGLGSIVCFSASNTARRSIGDNGVVSFPSNVQINGVLTVGASDRFDQQSDYSPTSNLTNPALNQVIDIVAPSHRAYPPELYAFNGDFGGIPGETFEIFTIDIPGNNGYNVWNDNRFGNFPALNSIFPNTGTNNLSYTGRMGGTSAACPQVAAVAALLLSINNSLSQQQVFDNLTNAADKVGGYVYNANCWSNELGFGRLNAHAALTLITNSINGISFFCNSRQFSVSQIPNGYTVNWTSSNNSIATVNSSGLVSSVSNGICIITATLNRNFGCGVPLQILTFPIEIGNPNNLNIFLTPSGTSLCTGTPFTAETYLDGATSYSWTAPSGLNFTSPNGTFQINGQVVSTPLGGQLTVTATNTCGTVSGSSDVVPLPEFPFPGKNQPYITLTTALCLSNIFQAQVVAVPNATLYWWRVREFDVNGNQINTPTWVSTATNISPTYNILPATRSARVFVYATTPCGNTVTINELFNKCKFARMANPSNAEPITVNPNPTKGIARIILPKEFGQNGTYELSSSHSGLVLKGRIINNKNYLEIDLTKFANGIYTLTMRDTKIIKQVKIVKE